MRTTSRTSPAPTAAAAELEPRGRAALSTRMAALAQSSRTAEARLATTIAHRFATSTKEQHRAAVGRRQHRRRRRALLATPTLWPRTSPSRRHGPHRLQRHRRDRPAWRSATRLAASPPGCRSQWQSGRLGSRTARYCGGGRCRTAPRRGSLPAPAMVANRSGRRRARAVDAQQHISRSRPTSRIERAITK